MVIASPRLSLQPLTVEALEALIAGDRDALEAVTGTRFPEPLAAPPLMGDALPFMRDALRESPETGRWGPYLLVMRETGVAVGSAGFTGSHDADGIVTLGYSVYPGFQGKGIASEAATAHAGLHRTDLVEDDPDEGPVEIWERARE